MHDAQGQTLQGQGITAALAQAPIFATGVLKQVRDNIFAILCISTTYRQNMTIVYGNNKIVLVQNYISLKY